jgi:hypothetical protein
MSFAANPAADKTVTVAQFVVGHEQPFEMAVTGV